MSRNTLTIDLVIAAVLTILIVVLAPGMAVVGIIAILFVLVAGISFGLDARRRRRARRRRTADRDRRSPRRDREKVSAPRR